MSGTNTSEDKKTEVVKPPYESVAFGFASGVSVCKKPHTWLHTRIGYVLLRSEHESIGNVVV